MLDLMQICKDEAKLENATSEERVAPGKGYGELMPFWPGATGVNRGTTTWPTNTTTVCMRKGETITSDPPHVETGKDAGGFFRIDAAIKVAVRVTGARNDVVETWPVKVDQGCDPSSAAHLNSSRLG